MEDRKSYIDKLANQLKEWDDQLIELEGKVEKTRAEAKAELLKQIEALKVKKAGAESKLSQIQEAGEEAWETLKQGFEEGWKDIRGAFANVWSKFSDKDEPKA